MNEYPKDFVSIGTVEAVYTTHVTHQEQFYIHLDTRSSILEEIMDKLETRYSQLGPNDKTVAQIKLGGLCAAKFTDDNNWYRVKITGLHNNGLIEVNFVDYGNTDYVSADRVKRLDPDLMQYPVQSYRCSLAGVSCKHGLWTPELRVQFEDLVIDKQCNATFTGKTEEDIYLLDMYDEKGRYINELFGATERKTPATDAKATGNGSHMSQGFDTVVWKEGESKQAVVVYVTNPDVFWCQEVKHTNDLIVLSEQLSRLHMTQEMGPLQNVRPGSICAAKSPEDEAWYRGIIQSFSRNQAHVYYVDYGNTEAVGIDSICELKPQFRALPALAVKCSLSSLRVTDGSSWSSEAIEEFEKMVVDKEFELNVVGRGHDGYDVSLLDIEENKDVATQLKQLITKGGIKARTPPKANNVNNNNSHSSPKSHGLDLDVGSTSDVFLSWVDNPADFWVQLDKASDVLERLSSELQEYYAQPKPAALSAPGAFVIARFSEDQQWYRGLVVKEFDDLVKVLFIDYGNADTIHKSELRQVNPQFGQIDPLAFRCCLKGVKPLPQDNSWSVDAKDFLEKLTENGCQCEVLSKNDAYRFVNLKVDGKDVTQELVSLAVVAGSQPTSTKSNTQGYLSSPKLRENQTEQVLVTHVDSPHSFWVQLNKSNSAVDAVMEKLDNHYSEEGGTPIARPAVGQACVAQYNLDNAWYRAVITHILPSRCEVHFVDYGNKEMVTPHQVCVAEPRFLDLPSQAIKCRLPLLGDVSVLTSAFSELVLEKDVSLNVLAGGEVPTVDLIMDGQSVCNILQNRENSAPSQQGGSGLGMIPVKRMAQGSTVKAFATMVHNPSRFFLQLSGTDGELSALRNQLNMQYVPQGVPVVSQPSVGMYCVALYPDDNLWYRGKILSVHGDQCQVLFVDYGNEEFVDNESIKVLTPEVSSSPILAYECSLHGVQVDEWSDSSIDYFDSLLMVNELSCTFISTTAITISCCGEDIAAKMISAGHCQSAVEPGPKSPLSVSTQGNFGGGRPQKSPAFGNSPRKEESSPGGLGGGKREGRGFGENRDNAGFGGGRRGNEFGDGRNESKGFGGGGEDRGDQRGFGGSRREGRDDRGGRRFGGGDESHKSDDGPDRGGFKSRSRDGGDSGFGGKRGGTDGEAGFGGGRRERNYSADSSSSTVAADKFSYADPPSEPESAILIHIDDNGTFYLQLPSMEKDIIFLSKRLAGSYKSGGPRLKGTVEKGTICCCKFPDDGSMYRCQVEAIDGKKVQVRYMDFGNIAEHSTFDLKFLFPDLLQYPAQAFPCKLRGLEWSLEKADTFASATLDKDLEVKFTSTTAPFEVDIKTPDGDLLSIMTGKIAPPAPAIKALSGQAGGNGGFGAKSPKGFGSRGEMNTSTPVKKSLDLAPSPKKPVVPQQIFSSQTAPSESQTAFISHISEDGYFYLQLEKDTDLLESLTEKLTKLETRVPHPDLSKGAACAAVFSEDSSWYRAKIIEVTNNQFTVIFVDFGNGDKVTKENILPLSQDLLSTAPLAYQCMFEGEEEALSDTSKVKMEEFLLEHQITVSFTGQSVPFAITATTSDGQDLHEIACPSNRFRCQAIPQDVTPAGVCHIEDDGRLFVCLFKKYKARDKLQKQLQNHYSSFEIEQLENFDADSPCCFKSPTDNLWHRCCIKNITDSKAEVQYVDSGKKESVETSDLKSLPTIFLKDPPFALECRLKGVESWTDELKEKFIDMTNDKILNATFHTTSPPYRVSLARSIELDLLGLSAPELDSPRKTVDKSVISNANRNRSTVFEGGDSYVLETTSQGIFYAQLASEEEQLQSLSDNLDAFLATEQTEPDTVEIGDMLCAKFSEDNVWYRATVEELNGNKVTVRFVDYGNTDSVGKERLSSIPDELNTASIPAFSYKCKLSTPPTKIEEFKAAVHDKMVNIVVISTEGEGIFTVDITLDGQQITLQETATTEESDVGQENTDSIPSSSRRKTVIVPFVTTPGDFYVQLQNEAAQLESMMNELCEHITSLADGEGLVPEDLAVGHLCAALYEESWYRVRVVSFGDEDQSVQVFYVDHGNTETVFDWSELRALPDKYQCLPLFGHSATLPGIKPCDNDWTEEAIETFRELVEEKSLLADLLHVGADKWIVQLLDMGTPVQDNLIAKGFGMATESVAMSKSIKRVFSEANESGLSLAEDVPTSGEKCWKKKISCISDKVEELKEVKAFVSHVDSPSQIWCQLASSTGELEELADKMETLYSTVQDSDHIAGDISDNDLVVGLFEEDGMRYRSVVTAQSSDTDKISLRFIDYGNCGMCERDQILNARDELCSQPALAFCCSLDKIQPLEANWSTEAGSRITELTADQELMLTLVGRRQDGTALVDLIIPETGKSLSSNLIEEGLAKSLDVDSGLPVTRGEAEKCDVSECLEITQPIMESTAMVDETAPNNYQDYSFGYAEDGHYRSIELNLHSSYAIAVCNNELPNAFCVQLKELQGQLEILSVDIQEYVDNNRHNDNLPKIGDPCLVAHEKTWERGLIRMENNDGSFIVYAVDIGWELSVKPDQIRPLPTQYLDLPGQAIHCYLAGVVSMGPEWSTEAINFFMDYIGDHDMHIDVQESAEDGKYGVSMTTMQDSTNEYAGSSLNQLMVELGHSDIVPGSNIEVQYDMERTLDTDMLDELEESFKEVETVKNKVKAVDQMDASTSQVDTFATTQEEEDMALKLPVEMGSKFYQLVHLSKSEANGQSLTQDEKNSEKMVLTKKDMAFDIASAVDRIDQMGCIDLFPEDGLTFNFSTDLDSLLEVSKENKSLNKEHCGPESSATKEKSPPKCFNRDDESTTAPRGKKSPLYTWSQTTSPENSTSSADKTNENVTDESSSNVSASYKIDKDEARQNFELPLQLEESQKRFDNMEQGQFVADQVNLKESSNTDYSREHESNDNLDLDQGIDSGHSPERREQSMESFVELNISEEEEYLLPYEYYEKLESKVKTTNGCKGVFENEIGSTNKQLQEEPSTNDRRVTLDEMGEMNVDGGRDYALRSKDVGEGRCEKFKIDDGGDYGEECFVDDMTTNSGEKDSSLGPLSVGCGKILDHSECEDDAKYLTLDQTGFGGSTELIDDLTNGYHASASDGTNSSGVLMSDNTRSLMEDDACSNGSHIKVNNEDGIKVSGIEDDDKYGALVENASFDIANVMAESVHRAGIAHDEDRVLSSAMNTEILQFGEQPFVGSDDGSQGKYSESCDDLVKIKEVDSDELPAICNKDYGDDNTQAVISGEPRVNVNGIQDGGDTSVEKDGSAAENVSYEYDIANVMVGGDPIKGVVHDDGELKSAVGNEMDMVETLTDNGELPTFSNNQDNGTKDDSDIERQATSRKRGGDLKYEEVPSPNCDTRPVTEVIDVCNGVLESVTENLTQGQDFLLRCNTKNLVNDKDGDTDDGYQEAGLSDTVSPESTSIDGSLFKTCLEPDLKSNGSCHEENNSGRHYDTTDAAAEVGLSKKEVASDGVDTHDTYSFVETIQILQDEKEFKDDEDGPITSVSTLDDTYDNYESASETFEDTDRTDSVSSYRGDSFYNYNGSLIIDKSADSSVDGSRLYSSDFRPDSSSCYDTSSLVFSDSQLDSSYFNDTSNTTTSTQTTEVSGYSFTDTSSTYNDISSSTYEDDDQTAGEESISSLSLESLNRDASPIFKSHNKVEAKASEKEVIMNDQDDNKREEKMLGETVNETQSKSLSDGSDKKDNFKSNSEQSGPASFHSADDDEEVISGNLGESAELIEKEGETDDSTKVDEDKEEVDNHTEVDEDEEKDNSRDAENEEKDCKEDTASNDDEAKNKEDAGEPSYTANNDDGEGQGSGNKDGKVASGDDSEDGNEITEKKEAQVLTSAEIIESETSEDKNESEA